MQLGKTFLGAIIGGLLGIGLLMAVHRWADGHWLAIPVALLTGLGVRMVATTRGHTSYVRGAITVLIAVVAYVSAPLVVAQVATHMVNKSDKREAAAAGEVASAESGKEATEPGMTPPAPAPDSAPISKRMTPDNVRNLAGPGKNPLDYLWLAIAALVAYELGRGTGTSRSTAEPGPAGEPLAVGTHPDA